MRIRPLFFIAAASTLFITSCQTYFIPVNSFRQQFAGFNSGQLRHVVTKNPMGDTTAYLTYPIDTILCIDKNGTKMVLQNSPALEIRFTDNLDKRTIFYFDLIRIKNDTVFGIQSRFMPSIRKSIALSNIKTIEIQNGGKRFRYVK